jgi:uncharacterized repeat protein (TIGR03833 family)
MGPFGSQRTEKKVGKENSGIPKQKVRLMNGIKREDLKPGDQVKIILKEDQRTGELTEGYVKDILTKSPKHLHGIKVRLVTGEVGRVKELLE